MVEPTEEEIKNIKCPIDAGLIMKEGDIEKVKEGVKKLYEEEKKLNELIEGPNGKLIPESKKKEFRDTMSKLKEPIKLVYTSLVATVKASESGKAPYSYTVPGKEGEKPVTVTCKKIQEMKKEMIEKSKKELKEIAKMLNEEDPFPVKLKTTEAKIGEGKKEFKKVFITIVMHPLFWMFVLILVVVMIRAEVNNKWRKAEKYQAIGTSI